ETAQYTIPGRGVVRDVRPVRDVRIVARTTRTIRTPNDPNVLPAEGETDRPPPEVEIGEVDVEVVALRRIRQLPVVPDVAAEPDVIRGEAHGSGSGVHAEFMVVDAEEIVDVLHVRLHDAAAS